MANRVLAYATDAEPTMHESGQEYMEGMWESVTIERSAAGQPGILIVMERRDGDLMEDQMVVHIKDGRKFLEHVIEWLAVHATREAERATRSVRSAVEAVVRGVVPDAVAAARVAEELGEAGLLASSLNQAKIEAYIKKLNGKGQHARKH